MPERLVGRNGDIWRDYIAGHTQEALGERYGISQQRVAQIIKEVRAQMPAEDLAELRQDSTELLRELRRATVELVRADLPPAYSNGRPILDENERMVRDAGPRLAAVKAALGVEDRLAKLLGLDAAAKVDVSVSEQAKAREAEAAADALSFLHGDGENTTRE
jgi:DNA-binding transcriptional regulator LsrR (DeoR family)